MEELTRKVHDNSDRITKLEATFSNELGHINDCLGELKSSVAESGRISQMSHRALRDQIAKIETRLARDDAAKDARKEDAAAARIRFGIFATVVSGLAWVALHFLGAWKWLHGVFDQAS